ncbi:MAG: 50S ribosomal protein L32 [Pseudohongiellaceae bacterium]
MAVQKNKVTRSKRNKRRTHDSLGIATISTDAETGERHRRHHMTPDGFFKGRQIVRNDDD